MKTIARLPASLIRSIRSVLAWPLDVLSPLRYMPESIAGLAGEDVLSADLLSSPAEAAR